MPDTPQKTSLVTQTRDVLERGIAGGRWRFSLPGERALSRELQVSRWTLRMALAALAREGVIYIRHGRACEIAPARQAARRRAVSWQTGCVLPAPLWQMRPFVALWVDALRVCLQELGGQFVLHDGARYFRPGGSRALAALTRQSPHDCWLLLLSNHEMQRWFHRRGLPVVVAGSSFDDAVLPSVDLDLRAMARHAAGVLLARGHRRIAMLTSHRGYAGVLDSERGLREAMDGAGGRGGELLVEYHGGEPAEICRKLDRLIARERRPTAFFIQQSAAWLTAAGHLARHGLLAPRDFSVIVAQDEPYLSHLVPEPARYVASPDLFARKIASLVRRACERVLPLETRVRLLPEFVPGQTIGPPASG
ncbi:substrate-binding domain-containing protein [Termitidicoccus mucosus]